MMAKNNKNINSKIPVTGMSESDQFVYGEEDLEDEDEDKGTLLEVDPETRALLEAAGQFYFMHFLSIIM